MYFFLIQKIISVQSRTDFLEYAVVSWRDEKEEQENK